MYVWEDAPVILKAVKKPQLAVREDVFAQAHGAFFKHQRTRQHIGQVATRVEQAEVALDKQPEQIAVACALVEREDGFVFVVFVGHVLVLLGALKSRRKRSSSWASLRCDRVGESKCWASQAAMS